MTIINDRANEGNIFFKDSIEKDIYRSKNDFPYTFKKRSSDYMNMDNDIDIVLATSAVGGSLFMIQKIQNSDKLKISLSGSRGKLGVMNANMHAKEYADIYVGDNSEEIQVYDSSGPVTQNAVLSLEEIEMQWICMESRGKSGRPGHYSYDPNPEWSDCNEATSHPYAPIVLLISMLTAIF